MEYLRKCFFPASKQFSDDDTGMGQESASSIAICTVETIPHPPNTRLAA